METFSLDPATYLHSHHPYSSQKFFLVTNLNPSVISWVFFFMIHPPLVELTNSSNGRFLKSVQIAAFRKGWYPIGRMADFTLWFFYWFIHIISFVKKITFVCHQHFMFFQIEKLNSKYFKIIVNLHIYGRTRRKITQLSHSTEKLVYSIVILYYIISKYHNETSSLK